MMLPLHDSCRIMLLLVNSGNECLLKNAGEAVARARG